MPRQRISYWLFYLFILISLDKSYLQTIPDYSIGFVLPEQCQKSVTPGAFHEFYDISGLSCRQCAQNNTFQVASSDGLQCECTNSHRLTENLSGPSIRCEACPNGQIASFNKWECVTCTTGESCPECDSSALAITVEKFVDGSNRTNNENQTIRECATCQQNSKPDTEGTKCERCNQYLAVNSTSCICPTLVDGLCFRSPSDVEPDYPEQYQVKFDSLESPVESLMFRQNVRSANGMCQPAYSNLTACQVLGNLCVLLLYTRANEPPSSRLCAGSSVQCNDACSYHIRLFASHDTGRSRDWRRNMPWLYYYSEDADRVLDETSIPTVYGRGSSLDLTAAVYSASGRFLGYHDVKGGLLQLCKDAKSKMDAAFVFGTKYSQKCRISVDSLFNSTDHETLFYDLYLRYGDNSMYAVPVLITNYADRNGNKVNQGSTIGDWQLVRRFFLVDRISGVTVAGNKAQVLRYPQSITLVIQLQAGSSEGKIYPPYLKITYGETTPQATGNVQVEFKTEYLMNTAKHNQDLSIAMGVMCALAVLYSFFQASNWNRRSGRIAIDMVTLLKFAVFTMGNIANAFTVVIFGWGLWWLIMYKRQDVTVLVPSEETDSTFRAYLGSAFALKAIHFIHLIFVQVTVDIFLIDWERPRQEHGSRVTKPTNDVTVSTTNQKSEPSIWRTYFVANEWNEIQTVRRILPIFQLLVVVAILEYFQVKNVASYDFESSVNIGANDYRGAPFPLFRFALATSVYIGVALVQWIYHRFIFERFWKYEVQDFVDLCSLCNISLFVMTHDQFGYYIHGRSTHGHADVDLRTMYNNMAREQENLCGNRGLIPGTDQQTFEIQLPSKLRREYDKVMVTLYPLQPGSAVNAQQTASRGRIDPQAERCLDAYCILNRFLQAFLNHSLQRTDYVIREKNILEKILNTEFQVIPDSGVFYPDSGHSFDQVLFFGHESTLQMFEILLFGVVDLASQNYVLAGVLTYLADTVICKIREELGQRNIAKKTMVDSRFLI